ncbi:MAG: acylphosphatase [Synergistaceae bacterium]|nr:acylphosphatase [Synergistaceae bacterium]
MQGVGFRHWTARTALSLGLTGWVRNLPDGSVEVQAQGEREALDKMAAWLRRGPSSARVTRLTIIEKPPERGEESFIIRHF